MPGLAARRNARNLAPIQTSFDEPSTAAALHDSAVASLPKDDLTHELKPPPAGETTPKAEPALRPRKSLTSLFDLFSRPNVERSRGHRETLPPMPDIPKEHKPPSRHPSTLSKRGPRPASRDEPESLRSRSSRPQLRATKSTKSLRNVTKKDEMPGKQFKAPWLPPPLFQAYPQAVMHTSLEAPEPSHGQLPMGDQNATVRPTDESNVAVDAPAKSHRFFGRMKSMSRLREEYTKAKEPSPSITQAWSRKVYILVTAGYLLQYAGDGPFDRLPEKILKIGPESAAFASDAIEGKHWVLEVLQTAKSDESSVHTSHKSFLSKFGTHNSYARRLVSNMLLIFTTPEEMDSWMVRIRKETGADEKQASAPSVGAASIVRYSSIVRHPSKDSRTRTPLPDSSHSSPTFVESQRASSTVIGSASSATFPSRYPRQLSPNQLPADQRTLSIASYRSDHAMIGPALKSPGFFERQATPSTAEFPESRWPRNGTDDNSPRRSPLTQLSIPSFNQQSVTLDRRRSMHSISSRSSNTGGEPDGLDFKHQVLQQRRSTTDLHRSADALDAKTASLLFSVPSPALQHFPEPPRRSSTMPSEMESIAESPPHPMLGGDFTNPVISGFNGLADSKRLPFTRASASFTPGAPTFVNGSRPHKRNSVFARPIPIATPYKQSAPAIASESSEAASRRTSTRNALSLASRNPTTQDLPISPTSSVPSGRTSQDVTLRRPASLQVSSDHTPFLTATRVSPRASMIATISTSGQTSSRVSVSRPPTLGKGTRTRVSTSHLHFPPPRPPPTMPLPAPPVMMG